MGKRLSKHQIFSTQDLHAVQFVYVLSYHAFSTYRVIRMLQHAALVTPPQTVRVQYPTEGAFSLPTTHPE
jgi:hypothetical protein